MSFQSLPNSLPMDKLFLDVRLEAIPLLGTTSVDLTGIKTFTVGMMRENKGFGITDIQIETKTSLQPVVDITFKDLYGNTVFDTLNDNSSDDTKLGYSLLFDWPPPKFRFTFKGYLGKPVTWIMNLKKTNTKYNANDGSYEIKCSFVPNQWGFLADIPFLYLLAKKRLKRDLQEQASTNSTNTPQSKVESIFDLIKIGKTIETKTKQITKEFDKLQKQLSVLKSNAIDGLINRDFAPNDVIDGKVAGRQPIKGVQNVSGQNDLLNFQTINITLPSSLDASDSVKFQETLKSLKADSAKQLVEHRKIIALIGNSNSSAKNMSTLGVENPPIPQEDVKAGVAKIDNDLKLIDVETKRRLFDTSQTQLGAVTISEVFSRLAADGAFILGSILDAGYNGYGQHTDVRMSNKLSDGQPLIGRFFPLTIDKQSGEQIPATAAGIEDIGCEMSFVRRFITAISEGIADNQTSQNADALSDSQNKLLARINNAEIINPNPYKDTSGQQLVETMLLRSGIAAYITRSFDPNKPGDYANTTFIDNDSTDEIKQLADTELKNITDAIISALSSEDTEYVKAFCRFINNLFDASGDGLLQDGVSINIPLTVDSPVGNYPNLKSFDVRVKKSSPNGDTFEDLGTIDSMFNGFVQANSIFYQGAPKGITDSINYDNFTAGYLYQNDTLWMLPQHTNEYTYVLFSNSVDQGAIDSAQNNTSDGDFNNKGDKESNHPLGIVKLTNGNDDKTKNPDEIQRLETINKRISNQEVLDYTKLKGIGSLPLIQGTTNSGSLYYPDTISINNGKGILVSDTNANGQQVASPITADNVGNGVTYLVYSHVTDDSDPFLTWGLFRSSITGGDVRGRNQRIFLRQICVDLENRLNKIADDKNNVLSQVLGKAQSNENSLYIQMHHIFHQWGVLGFSLDNASTNTNKTSDGSDKIRDQPIVAGKIATTLEETYGDIIDVNSNGEVTKIRNVEDLPGISSGSTATSTSSVGFRYDFPMERINPPTNTPLTNVGHSIINIEPLYKPNANTTLLNIIQQICTKNNFMFVPIPGNVDYTNISDIFQPSNMSQPKVGNVFHVLFTPTPENRTKHNDGTPLNLNPPQKSNFDAFEILMGSPDNTIIKSVDVSTDESKPTAESILNLQRLVDKDNSNKAVTTDCSILSVMEGRSYKMKVDMLGNAQISPMQYFYVPKIPIFSGLYQVMGVNHSITPNSMSTSFEGIKMRFDGTSMKGVGPITLESLKALSDNTNVSQPIVNTSSPTSIPTGATINGLPNPFVDSATSVDLDYIPGTYLNNNKQSISLVQIDGKPVELSTAKAYFAMKKAADKEGVILRINSGFRPPYGDGIHTTSSFGVKVNADSQHQTRAQLLQKPNYPNPDQVKNPQGQIVSVDSGTLTPQEFQVVGQGKSVGYFTKAVAAPGSSNHGNGIAVDLNTGSRRSPSSAGPLNSIVYIWLVRNSWKYGFVRTVASEEWHFDYKPNWAQQGPYGGLVNTNGASTNTIDGRNSALFYNDLGLSNLSIASL